MSIFERDKRRDFLSSLAFARVLFNSGFGLESVLKHLSEADLGGFSRGFKKVIEDAMRGVPAGISLKGLEEKEEREEVSEFYQILREEGDDSGERFERLAEKSLKGMELEGVRYSKRLSLLLRIFELLLVFTFSIYVVDFLNYSLPGGWGGGMEGGIKPLVLFVSGLSLLIVTILSRRVR